MTDTSLRTNGEDVFSKRAIRAQLSEKVAVGLNEVNRRFGRISGALALVCVAVFAKFGWWQALTERCCGMLEAVALALPLAFLPNGSREAPSRRTLHL